MSTTTSPQDRLAKMRAMYGEKPAQTNSAPERLPNNYYDFWNMEPGKRAVIRFVPDANLDNPSFMLPKATHILTINGKETKVPCLKNYGEDDCPICKKSQEFYKVNDKVNGKKYYRKMQHLAQALVIEDPLPPNKDTGETHQGHLRNISIGHQLFTIIREALTNADEPLDMPPEDFDAGYDFIIKKTEQGEYSTYTMGTKFMSRPRALTEEELATAKEFSKDLSTLLPRRPSREQVEAMLNAALTGEVYDEQGADQSRNEVRKEAPVANAPKAGVSKPARQASEAAPWSDEGMSDDIDAVIAQIQRRREASQG